MAIIAPSDQEQDRNYLNPKALERVVLCTDDVLAQVNSAEAVAPRQFRGLIEPTLRLLENPVGVAWTQGICQHENNILTLK